MKRKAIGDEGRGSGTQKKLLQAALELFSEKGYDKATIREISERAGTTLPSIYYHFGNKEGLLRALLEHHFAIVESVFAAHGSNGNTREQLKSLILSLYLFLKDNKKFATLMRYVHPDTFEDQLSLSITPINDRLRAIIVAILEGGMKRGDVRAGNADDMAMVLYGILFTASDQVVFDLFSDFDENKLEAMLDLVLGWMYTEKKPLPA